MTSFKWNPVFKIWARRSHDGFKLNKSRLARKYARIFVRVPQSCFIMRKRLGTDGARRQVSKNICDPSRKKHAQTDNR